MNLLLDTHAYLWFMEGSERISQRARAEMEGALGPSLIPEDAFYPAAPDQAQIRAGER